MFNLKLMGGRGGNINVGGFLTWQFSVIYGISPPDGWAKQNATSVSSSNEI